MSSVSLINVIRNKTNPAYIAGFVALGLWVCSNLLRPAVFQREQHFIAPPKDMTHFVFGYNESVADLLWIRSIQDFDYCEQKVAENVCKGQSWLYRILDVVSDLSPRFRTVHSMGPIALSIVISDIEGASKLFDKSVKNFPKDWVILGRAAYHALYEENNKTKAAALLKSGAENGGPFWYYSLSGRLFAEGGDLELGEALLKELKDSGQPEHVIDRLTRRLEDYKKKQQNSSSPAPSSAQPVKNSK